jgi:maleylacetoacetate isomerase
MSNATLFGYWRSSASYRVRIGCNLKGLKPEQAFVHLRKGEQRGAEHLARNPLGLVPVWREDGFLLSQSLAILEYLDETHPEPPLLSHDPRERATIRELALIICADIHPIGNLRVLHALTSEFGADEAARAAWSRCWIGLGLTALEARLSETAGQFAVGDRVSLADICLVPQLYNARRFDLDLRPFPIVVGVDANARALPAFVAAAPENQTDAE